MSDDEASGDLFFYLSVISSRNVKLNLKRNILVCWMSHEAFFSLFSALSMRLLGLKSKIEIAKKTMILLLRFVSCIDKIC